MDYPKMLYKCETMFADEDALKAGVAPGGAVRNMIVSDETEDAQAQVDGWVESPMDFLGAAPVRRGRKAKADDAKAEGAAE
jgi:hypothetical protein